MGNNQATTDLAISSPDPTNKVIYRRAMFMNSNIRVTARSIWVPYIQFGGGRHPTVRETKKPGRELRCSSGGRDPVATTVGRPPVAALAAAVARSPESPLDAFHSQPSSPTPRWRRRPGFPRRRRRPVSPYPGRRPPLAFPRRRHQCRQERDGTRVVGERE